MHAASHKLRPVTVLPLRLRRPDAALVLFGLLAGLALLQFPLLASLAPGLRKPATGLDLTAADGFVRIEARRRARLRRGSAGRCRRPGRAGIRRRSTGACAKQQ